MDAKALRVVRRCLADVCSHPVDNVDIYVGDDITVWYVALNYPDSAPFTGGNKSTLRASNFSLYFMLRFDQGFPAKPPAVKLLSPWKNHQHLWGERLCHSLLSDDFAAFFAERRVHGTSLWNASCALVDTDGIGGMPRYLSILREFLASDPDYDEEQHFRYDEASLAADVKAQRQFRPEFWAFASRVEPLQDKEAQAQAATEPPAVSEWGSDFFLKCRLVPGDAELHPCFDVALEQSGRRPPLLSTTMTALCPRSFDEGARTTDFGSAIAAVLPHPCSPEAWSKVGSRIAAKTLETLQPLAAAYELRLPGLSEAVQPLEHALNIVGEIWKSTCISIVKDEGYQSERAMACFVTLHYLLLCLAEDLPHLRQHAAASVRQFLQLVEAEPSRNLKVDVPDLGRFLVRFLLCEESVPLKSHLRTVVRELFNRNVRWVEKGLWARPTAGEGERERQVLASFEQGHFGMKLTVFQSYYILRSAELGLDTLAAHHSNGGWPPVEVLRIFQQDCSSIKELGCYQEFFLWLKLDELLDEDVHGMLCWAVDESEARGYNILPPRF